MRRIIKRWNFLKRPAVKEEVQFFKLFKYSRILAGETRSELYTTPGREANTPDEIRKRELPFFYCWYKYNTSAPAKILISKTAPIHN
ncbi:hypothetical protein A8C56_22535 [Niabella ginsenosidivorans]|uniref:Uncharacterized protein n=1 Tax=Niabella ginsenosidivorans TaxID=1176587 RepID=A0A1A9I9N8_9BACT|nr:hypothetical protein [Niabella ginsenosidivorans]ANH83391.1 hypothetical protein A8C56_22535 [Niabella ginsenosidivorans]